MGGGKRWVWWGASLLVVLIGYLWWTRESIVIRVDYMAKLQAEIASEPERRGWELYLPVLVALGTRAVDPSEDAWPGTEAWQPWQELLAEMQEHWPALDEAVEREQWGAPHDPHLRQQSFAQLGLRDPYRPGGLPPRESPPPIWTARIENLIQVRALANLFVLRARERAGVGEHLEAARCLARIDRLATQLRRRALLIEQVIGESVAVLGAEERLRLARRHGRAFAAESWDVLTLGLRELRPSRDLRHELRGERWFVLDIVQRVYTDDGKGDGHFAADPALLSSMAPGWTDRLGARIQGIFEPTRKEVLGQLERLWQAAADPSLAPSPVEIEGFGTLAKLHAPVMSRDRHVATARLHAIGVALAILRSVAEEGAATERLPTLAPRFVDAELLEREGEDFAYLPPSSSEPLVLWIPAELGAGLNAQNRSAIARSSACVLTDPLFEEAEHP